MQRTFQRLGYNPLSLEDIARFKREQPAEWKRLINLPPIPIDNQGIAVMQTNDKGQTPDTVIAMPENQWIGTTLVQAINDKFVYIGDVQTAPFEIRRQMAIDYQMQYYWYFFFHPEVKKWMANEFRRISKLTDQQMYKLMRANDYEPWISVLAYLGGGTPLAPNSPDSRTRYVYEIEYPFDAYLIQYWWPTYGNTSRHGDTDKFNFKYRISHITPNIPLVIDNTIDSVKKKGKALDDSWEKNKGYILGGIAAVIIVSGIGASAALVNEIKK